MLSLSQYNEKVSREKCEPSTIHINQLWKIQENIQQNLSKLNQNERIPSYVCEHFCGTWTQNVEQVFAFNPEDLS